MGGPTQSSVVTCFALHSTEGIAFSTEASSVANPIASPAAAPANKLHSFNYVCALLGVSRKKLYQMLADRELEHVRIGRNTKVPDDTLRAFLERQRRNGRPVPHKPSGVVAAQTANCIEPSVVDRVGPAQANPDTAHARSLRSGFER